VNAEEVLLAVLFSSWRTSRSSRLTCKGLKVAGATVINCFGVQDAIRSISLPLELSAAVLDVNLGTEDCSRVCRALARRHVPFVFYTAYRRTDVVDQWPAAPVIFKPASMTKIVAAVAKLVGRGDRPPD
jgi:DNA-binding response OmpR family regulator